MQQKLLNIELWIGTCNNIELVMWYMQQKVIKYWIMNWYMQQYWIGDLVHATKSY